MLKLAPLAQQFLPEYRLHKADEFSSVFIFRKARFSKFFKLHYKPNELAHSRLGMIIGRKIHKRSNRRNYCKRIVREYFRTHQAAWANYDVVFRIQYPFTRQSYTQALAELEQITRSLKCTEVATPHPHPTNS